MRIEKKIWPEYFQRVLNGTKTFELRLADFICKSEDVLVLKEWDPKKKQFTGRVIEKQVTHVMRTKDVSFWPKEDVERHGFQIISFR